MLLRNGLIVVVTMVLQVGCISTESTSSSPSADDPAPQCPATDVDKDYVGCWDDLTCLRLDLTGSGEPDQWRLHRYYLTADGQFYDFAWAYDNSNCTGNPILTDNGVNIRLRNFTDQGTATMQSGNIGHQLLFTGSDDNSYTVLSEVNPVTGDICFSNNLDVSTIWGGLWNRNGTEIDYTNCLVNAR